MLKWNKKICVEYIHQMKSPIEEQAGVSNNLSPLQKAADGLKRLIAKKP